MNAAELRMLSTLLGAPDESALEVVREAAAESGWLTASAAELAAIPLDQWQGEHTRLFIAGYPRTPCPPFASAWTEKRMHGGAMEALMRFYGRIGLTSEGMPADFLGTILECAALLAEEIDHADVSAELWRDHLLPWLPDLTAALARESRLKIYRAVAERLEELCNENNVAPASVSVA